MTVESNTEALAARLSEAGVLAADEEAAELIARAGDDPDFLDSLVQRRIRGEPLAWITGSVRFCGVKVRVHPGVYVPRWQSAIAKVLTLSRPDARVMASDIDDRAVACAAANGVDVYQGDLFASMPRTLEGLVDVVVGVVPYVPTAELVTLPRETLVFESALAFDGGPDGTDVLRRVLIEAPRFLRPGGVLLLELGGDQADLLADDLARLGYVNVAQLVDEDGDLRGIDATIGKPGSV